MKKIAVGYLSYINEINKSKRFEDFKSSLDSLKNIQSKNVELLSIDNASIAEATFELKSSQLFSKYFHYQKNHYDVVLFYTTAWYALQNNIEYICFLYDDFIVYDDAFDDIIDFMNLNADVHCVRIPSYEYENQSKYNSDITSKRKNPDSIRHHNFITKKKLVWEGPFNIGKHIFYKNNWHYTSRPIVWRTDYFAKMLTIQGDKSRVLQGFEEWAQQAFEKEGLKTGVLDTGMVKTTSVEKSARTLELEISKEYQIQINVNDLHKDYKLVGLL